MPQERNLKRDLFALGLTVATIVVAISLFTYDRADPPGTLVYPANSELINACGPFGAYLAHYLLTALGVGAYYLVGWLGFLVVLLLARVAIREPVLRGVGWIVSLAGVTTLAAMATPWLSPGPVIGSGGYMGAALGGLLQMHFASFGAYVLVVSLVVGGLLLATDYVLFSLGSKLVTKPAQAAARGLSRAHASYMLRRAGGSEVAEDEGDWEEEDDAEEEDASAEPTVRVMGQSDEDEAEEEEEHEEEEAADESEESGEDTARKPIGSRLASALRIRKPERQEVMQQLEAADQDEELDYELPPLDLLLEGEPFSLKEHEREVRRRAKILEKTFRNFGFNIRVVEIQTGPVIAQYEVELEAGLRLSKITGLAEDLAIALRVPTVRIVAPIPGKNTVGIEVPNTDRQLVRLREVIEETNGRAKKMKIPLYLGKDVAGSPMVVDLATLPHLLIAGRTGTGKSVALNTMIMSMLMSRRPDEVRMLLIDPKMVELTPYSKLPHLMHPVITDMKKAEAVLEWAVAKMEERYSLLARAGVRHVSVYNQLGEEELMERLQPQTEEERQQIPRTLPFVVIVADEMADLMMTAPKEVEGHIIRLAQKSRAVGIHLVLATQKPTVDVITGLIKSNLPARISFQVSSKTDSRVVLDETGAEKLLGNGDMLFLWPGTSTLLRGQGAYVADEEISDVVGHVGHKQPNFVPELVQLPAAGAEDAAGGFDRRRDEMYEPAVDVVVSEGRGSVSLLQRALGIGYGRAARLIDFMAEDGIVGDYNGSQARDVLITPEQWKEMKAGGAASPKPTVEPAMPKRPPRNRIQLAEPRPIDAGIDEDDIEETPPVNTARGTAVRPHDDETPPWEDDEEEVYDEADDEELEYDDPEDAYEEAEDDEGVYDEEEDAYEDEEEDYEDEDEEEDYEQAEADDGEYDEDEESYDEEDEYDAEDYEEEEELDEEAPEPGLDRRPA